MNFQPGQSSNSGLYERSLGDVSYPGFAELGCWIKADRQTDRQTLSRQGFKLTAK